MRAASAAQIAFLASRRNCLQADLFKIVLQDGTVYTWTSHDRDLLVPPYTYSALGPLIDRTKWGIKNTIDVPEMEVIIYSNGYDMPDGSNLKLAVHNGLFDYSTVTLSRLFMPTPDDTSLGPIDIFTGNAAGIEIDALSITITVKGANVALDQYMPRNQYQLGCIHSVYDAGCAPNPGQPGGGPSRAANTFVNNVGGRSTRSLIYFGSYAGAPDPQQLALGYITFTSGANNGTTRVINSVSEGGMSLAYPLYVTPTIGDLYTITYGCNRTRGAKGCTFFNNLQHFRGFPYVPPAEFGV